MPTFRLGECSMSFHIEPLVGPLATEDRQLAWRVYLALVARPALRDEELPAADLRDFVTALRSVLEQWPSWNIEKPSADHLGYMMVNVIEVILLPCLQHGARTPGGWAAVREFCHALARDLARCYRFPDGGACVPHDMLEAWRTGPSA